MATVAELKAVLKDTLEKRGALAQIKARIRAEVFNALDDQSEPRPALSRENLLINELIREYLDYNKYKYTASVLTAESGQPEVPLDRQFLAKELNIVEDASGRSVPLLYGILSHFLHGGKEEGTQNILPKVSLLNYPKQNLGKPPAERSQKGSPCPVDSNITSHGDLVGYSWVQNSGSITEFQNQEGWLARGSKSLLFYRV